MKAQDFLAKFGVANPLRILIDDVNGKIPYCFSAQLSHRAADRTVSEKEESDDSASATTPIFHFSLPPNII